MRYLFPVSTGFFRPVSEFGFMISCFHDFLSLVAGSFAQSLKASKSAAYSRLSAVLRPVSGPVKAAFHPAPFPC